LPRRPGATHYWIPAVQDWAAARGLPIRHIDPLWIEVSVSRAQLLEFIDVVYGTNPDESVARLRAHIAAHGRDDKTYLIVADEF
jgi:hypothetical protein